MVTTALSLAIAKLSSVPRCAALQTGTESLEDRMLPMTLSAKAKIIRREKVHPNQPQPA